MPLVFQKQLMSAQLNIRLMALVVTHIYLIIMVVLLLVNQQAHFVDFKSHLRILLEPTLIQQINQSKLFKDVTIVWEGAFHII